MGRVIRIADKIVNGCLFFLTLVLVFTTGTQISLRVLFDLPLSWTEEVARYAFIWWVFFGAMIALRERRHLGIDALVTLFPRRLLRYWEIGIYVCILGYLIHHVHPGHQAGADPDDPQHAHNRRSSGVDCFDYPAFRFIHGSLYRPFDAGGVAGRRRERRFIFPEEVRRPRRMTSSAGEVVLGKEEEK